MPTVAAVEPYAIAAMALPVWSIVIIGAAGLVALIYARRVEVKYQRARRTVQRLRIKLSAAETEAERAGDLADDVAAAMSM
ncbi:MAG: hypothetical protein AAGJ87_17110, partial [Pseudomonadota bacterium]